MTESNFFFSTSATIDQEGLHQRTGALSSPELAPVALAFRQNIDELRNLWALPVILITAGTSEISKLMLFMEALAKTGNLTKWHQSVDAQREVFEEAERLRIVNANSRESKFDPVKMALNIFDHLCENDEAVRASIRAMLFSCTVSAWASFECVAKDAWIVALNSMPGEIGQHVFSEIREDDTLDGLASKQVSVGFLAKHGFNLRNCLGTVLAQKFDFTSVNGIRKAFTAAFRKHESLIESLGDHQLAALEATRHLIVHRAGIIDDTFLRRTNINAPIGLRYELDGETTAALCNAGVQAGCCLLECVDTRLADLKKPNN